MDIDKTIRAKVYTQQYGSGKSIEGVTVIDLTNHVGEDSDFCELMRLTPNGESELFPGFVVRQINRSTQIPGSIKAWHVHLVQDEVWYVPGESRLLTGLWDVREQSPTKGNVMRIPMGGGSHKMLLIPHGVAHGSTNVSNELGVIIYFVNSQFDKNNPDEHRIPWDAKGADIWKPHRD